MHMIPWRTARMAAGAAALAAGLGLAGCGGDDVDVRAEYPSDDSATTGTYDPKPYSNVRSEHLLGGDGIVLFGGPDYEAAQAAAGGAGIGVNAYLWRATLDTLSFMPLASADPFGGVVITDWYTPPASPDERFKATAYILERTLRADGVRVAVFRQVAEDGAGWRDAKVGETLGTDLENTILTRARQLRVRAAAAAAAR